MNKMEGGLVGDERGSSLAMAAFAAVGAQCAVLQEREFAWTVRPAGFVPVSGRGRR
jgi:hypothetical protein